MITCDGSAPNKKFFKMHAPATKKGKVVYIKTLNPYAKDKREIFFMSDVPHLKKLVIVGQTHLDTIIHDLFG